LQSLSDSKDPNIFFNNEILSIENGAILSKKCILILESQEEEKTDIYLPVLESLFNHHRFLQNKMEKK
jgi:hypothetical protein